MTHHIDLDTITLEHGGHDTRDDGVCFMELVAWLAGEPHSDRPACASPVLAAFARAWNDALPTRERQALKRHAHDVIGTAGRPDLDERAGWMAVDWLVRTHTPAWLRVAGLDAQAERLEVLPELNRRTVDAAVEPAYAAREDAYAAGAAAGEAARAAAWDAARAAAGDAAWAAGAAAGATAWDAARGAGVAAGDAAFAAWDAARAAARAAGDAVERLRPTVERLRTSAHELFQQMIGLYSREAARRTGLVRTRADTPQEAHTP